MATLVKLPVDLVMCLKRTYFLFLRYIAIKAREERLFRFLLARKGILFRYFRQARASIRNRIHPIKSNTKLISFGTNSKGTVYLHITFVGTYIGNGGFVMLANLANELADLGYSVRIFDHKDRLRLTDFNWLCFNKMNFEIVPSYLVFGGGLNDNDRILTSWISPLLPNRYDSNKHNDIILNHTLVPYLRYWCQSELLRDRYDYSAHFVLRHCDKIAINNHYLNNYYEEKGFKEIFFIDNWIQHDLFNYNSIQKKINNSIGYQLSPNFFDREYYYFIKSKFKSNIISCNGSREEVSRKMKISDFFIFAENPSPAIGTFKGQTFGLSLYEAMACGCVCVGIKHEGNRHLNDVMALFENIDEAIEYLKEIAANPLEKERIREKSLEYIQEHYIFNDERKKAIEELLE